MKRIATFFLAFLMVLTCFPAAAFAAETKASVGMADIGPEGYQKMTSSQKMLDMLKSMEGFYEEAYWDYGQWTIGYGSFAGSYNYNEKPTQKLTPDEAEELLRVQLREGYETKNGRAKGYEQYVNDLCRSLGKQPSQHQFDALVLFTYNVGGSWTTSSRVKSWLANPTTELDFVKALGSWKRAGGEILYGLVQRRIREAVLFLKGEYSIASKAVSDWNIKSDIAVVSPSALPYYSSATFKLDGGKVSSAYNDGDKYDDFVVYYEKDWYYSPLPLPTKEGFTFAGWKITRIGNNKTTIGDIVTIETKVEKTSNKNYTNVELTAQWVPAGTQVQNSDKLHGMNTTIKPEVDNTPNTGENSKPIVQIPAAGQPFEDVYTNSWFLEDVVFVYEKGYMNGMEKTIFGSDQKLTRGMLVTVLYRMDGEPTVKNDKHGFQDVPDDQYYSDAVAWAKENGIVKGMSDTEFAPGAALTRQQAVTIFYRYCVEYKKADGSRLAALDAFPDGEEVDNWAEAGMKWAVANNVITGNAQSDGTVILDVNGTLIRSQCAAMIHRCCKQILKEA